MAYNILAQFFLAGARSSYARYSAISAFRGGALNEMELLTGKGLAQIEFTNYQQLMNILKVVGPDLQKNFKKDSVKLASTVRNPLKQTLRSIGSQGPLPGAKRPGRNYDRWVSEIGLKSWGGTGGNRRKYDEVRTDFKDRNSARETAKLRNSQSGRLGIVRLRVTSGPTIIADLAGASRKYMYGKGSFMSTEYRIRLFGRFEITRRHRINKENSDNFVRKLATAGRGKLRGKPSRYAYPSVQKNKGKFEKEMTSLIAITVRELNARINK